LKLLLIISFQLAVTGAHAQYFEDYMGDAMARLSTRTPSSSSSSTQSTSKTILTAGYDFVAPSGWNLMSMDDKATTCVLQHTTMPGIIITMPHQIGDVNSLTANARLGIQEAEIVLTPVGQIIDWGLSAIQLNYVGYYKGQSIKGYAIHRISSAKGGVTILTFSASEAFTNDHIQAVRNLGFSMVFHNTTNTQPIQVASKTAEYDFNTPNGWTLMSTDNSLSTCVLQNSNMLGAIVTTAHQIGDINALLANAQMGFYEAALVLTPVGQITSWGDHGIQVNYEGYAQGQALKGYAISLIGSAKGGATILTFSASEAFTNEHIGAVRTLAHSMVFPR
jgi:hypothetical protein